MSLMSRTSALGLATILRATLMLVLSALVYKVQSADEAAVFFQILFFQGIAIAFLSANGFFRVLGKDADHEATHHVFAMSILILPSLVLPLAVVLFIPGYDDRLTELMIAWAGAVSTAFASPFSGIVLRTKGAFAAFLPAGISAGIAVLVLLAMGQGGFHPLLPYLTLAGFQALTVVLLMAQIPRVLAEIAGLWRRVQRNFPAQQLKEVFVVGAGNVAFLMLVLTIREFWADRTGAEIAATVFFALRISDSALQLYHMIFAGHGIARRILTHPRALIYGLAVIVASVVVNSLLGQALSSGMIGVIVFAVLGQIALDIVRFPCSVSFLYQMANFHLRRYMVFLIAQPVLALAVGLYPIMAGRPEGILIFMAMTVGAGFIVTALQARRVTSPGAP